jgi:uracil-DNA glycosylase
MLKQQLKQHLEMELSFGGDNIFLKTEKIKPKSKQDIFKDIHNKVSCCEKCQLCKTRNNIVFGEGSIDADLMFIGESPEFDEDKTGKQFVGKAGQLLIKMITAMKLDIKDVFITNIVKCCPPQNRNPLSEEVDICSLYLKEQIELIQPKIICALGEFATQWLLNESVSITSVRGKLFNYNGIKLVPTFHPLYLLSNENMKKFAWQDLKLIMSELGNI